MNKHKLFIKDCYEGKHGEMCSDWKETILKHYPEFKGEDFKVGDWVVGWHHTNNDFYYSPWKLGGFINSGYLKPQLKLTEGWNCHKRHIRKATKEEIENHLIKEAERKGFKYGVRVNGLSGTKSGIILGLQTPFTYEPIKDRLFSKEHCIIYENGKWAEIIETITKKEAEKQLGKKII